MLSVCMQQERSNRYVYLMSDKYKAIDNSRAHFVTITVISWIDLFTRNSLRRVVTDSLQYC